MTKQKRLKLIKEAHLRALNQEYEEDRNRSIKDYHPEHPDNK